MLRDYVVTAPFALGINEGYKVNLGDIRTVVNQEAFLLNERWSGVTRSKANTVSILSDLNLCTRHEVKPFTELLGNNHATTLVDGSSHT